jgi:predicted RecB family nuclease
MQSESLHYIPGITRSQAGLLEASGVKSTDDLAKNHPEKLLRWMAEVNADRRLVRRLPSLEQVSHWIGEARSLQPA